MEINLLSRSDLLHSLETLGQRFRAYALPEEVEAAALAANPWYTQYYLKEALAGIGSWLERDRLQAFLQNYPEAPRPPQQVGIITAGNLPLVGFHDVLMTLLAGHVAWVKASQQDQVLMTWLHATWIEIFPNLANFFHLNPLPPQLDFLLATGSDNTARQIEQAFEKVPKIVRKNRYSVALLTPETRPDEWKSLYKDLLFYNGLGCRNVSNLIVLPGVEVEQLHGFASTYPPERFNPYYMERVLYLKAKHRLLRTPVLSHPYFLLRPSERLRPAEMGMVWFIRSSSQAEALRLIADQKDQVQCQVGIDTAFGQTQRPGLSDFADGVDTLKVLTSLPTASAAG